MFVCLFSVNPVLLNVFKGVSFLQSTRLHYVFVLSCYCLAFFSFLT